tara:strand:- start:70 stop:1236 length:1167 start_codon:yes stop_codon:yes gene_type:complete
MDYIKQKIKVGHLIDFVGTSNTWFKVLMENLNTENLILPYTTEKGFEIEKEGIKLITTKKLIKIENQRFSKIINRINTYYIHFQFKRIIRKNNIQVLHAHFAHIGWESIRLKKTLKIPLITSYYGYDYQSVPHKYPVWNYRYKELFNSADKIVCEGKNGPKILTKMGCDPKKIQVLKLGIQFDKIQFKQRVKKRGYLNLVQIANLVEKKGHKFTLLAFSKALESCPNMHLTIVGNGAECLKKEIHRIIIDHNLTKHVTQINRIDYSKLHTILGDYEVFIHPSCYSKEMDCEGGAPIVLLDAQATGLPVISTDHCDIPDEVIHNVTGKIAKEKNIEQLAEYISFFYDMSQEDYNSFSFAARKHIKTNYNIIKNGELFSSLYKNILFESS